MGEQNKTSALDDIQNAAQKVKGAVKAGKAVAEILKGAAAGGLQGAALAAAKAFKKEIIIAAIVLLMIPVLILTLLPQVIFGSLYGGTDGGNGTGQPILNDNAAIVQNISKLSSTVAGILSEGYEATKETVESLATGIQYVEIVDTVGGDIVFDANQIICWYSASQNKSVENISLSHIASLISPHKNELYYYETNYESRQIEEDDGNGGTVAKTVTFTIFTIFYRGDDYFPTNVFVLTLEQLALSGDYAANLTMFLYDSYGAAGNGAHDEIARLLGGDETLLEDGIFGNPFPGMDWSGHISSTFGPRPYPGVGKGTSNHTGLDLQYPIGTPIHAVMGGTVLFVKDSGSSGYGKHLAVNHGGGYVTLYAHCSSISVAAGQRVERGDKIAEVGKTGWVTGAHLHIEVIINGKPVNPIGYISNN